MRLLIIKTSSFGDIIQSFDLLVYVKKKIPHAKVDWVVESSCHELVSRHPLVDQVYQISRKNLKKGAFSFIQEIFRFWKKVEKYDIVLDIQGNIKSSLFLMGVSAKKKVGFCKKTVSEWPNLLFTNWKISPPKGQNVRQEVLFFGQSIFQDFSDFLPQTLVYPLTTEEEEQLHALRLPDVFFILAPFSRWPTKELDPFLFKQLIEKHLPIEAALFLVCKGSEEKKKADAFINSLRLNAKVLEGLSLPLLAAVLCRAMQAICMDSMILHLAAAVGCPTVSFFSASNGNKYAPLGKEHIVYKGSCPYKKEFERRCPYLRKCSGPCCLKFASGDPD